MQLTKNFNLKELLVTSHGDLFPEQFSPSQGVIANLTNLATTVLQPLRDMYGKPIRVTSAYRCLRLNSYVKGSKTSTHRLGLAADLQCEDNWDLFELICRNLKDFKVDQVIHEYGTPGNPKWVHVGMAFPPELPRHQIMIKGKGPYKTLKLSEALKLRR